MNRPPKTVKRVVSKGEYVRAQAEWARKCFQGFAALIAGSVCLLVALMCPLVLLEGHGTIRVLALFLVCGTCGSVLIKQGSSSLYRLEDLKVAPLTRANTADLPAPDSLVRAGEKPMREQQKELLRAAAKGPETPPEQLVRPVQ